MVERKESESPRTTVQKKSDREVVVTRTFDAPARLVFEAWSRPELFKKWWVPRSMGMTLRSCDMDVRTGGKYRLVFGDDPANTMAFFGQYIEVVPDQRIVWTNEESGDQGSVTTVTFEERDGKTRVCQFNCVTAVIHALTGTRSSPNRIWNVCIACFQ